MHSEKGVQPDSFPTELSVPRASSDATDHTIEHAGMDLRYKREQVGDVTAYNIWVPGFFGIHSAYEQLRQASAQIDLSSGNISMHAPRKHDLWHSLALTNTLHPSLMLSKAVWGIMKDTAQETGVSRFNLIGHSMGGPAVVNAASYMLDRKDPSMINSVTLNASAGVTNHNIASLAPRAARLLGDEIRNNWPELSKRVGGQARGVATKELISYMFHRQTFLEMLAVSNCNILGRLATLTEAGIPTAGLFFPGDPLFDAEKAEKNLRGRINLFEVMDQPNTAGHVAPQLYPYEVANANYGLRQTLSLERAA